MLRRIIVALTWLACTTPCAAAPTILVIGDSLSSGHGLSTSESWVTLLQVRLRERGFAHRVVNSSVSGDTTANGVTRIRASLERHRPAIVILELGGNDGLRGQPVASIRANLATMIESAHAAGAQVVLAGMRMPPNYGAVYGNRFMRLYSELAEQYDTALIPFFMAGVATVPGMMQPDGIHPSAAAQEVLLENVWTHLRPLLAPRSSRGPVPDHQNPCLP